MRHVTEKEEVVRKAKVLRLLAMGLEPVVIATRLGMQRGTVYKYRKEKEAQDVQANASEQG